MNGRVALIGAGLAALASVWLVRGFARGGDVAEGGAKRESSARTAEEPGLDSALERDHEHMERALEAVEEGSAPAVGERTEVPPASESWLLGTLVDPEGRPIAGAQVTLHDGPLYDAGRSGPPRARSTAVSGDDGRFHFPAPEREGRFGVSVTAAGFAPRSRDQSPGVDVPFDLVPEVRAHGRILGEGAERARVFRLSEAAPERVDDGAGRWSADGLALGRPTRFELVPADAAPIPFALEPTEPGALVFDLEFGPRREFRGEVVELLTRCPIPGAVLASESERAEGRLAVSDAEGAFAFAVRIPARAEPDELEGFTLLVSAAGYLVGSSSLAELERTGRLELVPSGTLEGRVVDGEGRAVAGVRLAWGGPLYLPDARLGLLRVPELAPVFSAEDGSFRLVGVPCAVDGSALEVQHGSTPFLLYEVAPLRPDEPRVLQVRLGRGRTLVGQLRWEGAELLPHSDLAARFAGEPVLTPPSGITVRLASADGERSTVSDARGAFRFEQLPGGRISVSVLEMTWLIADDGEPPGSGAVAPTPTEDTLLQQVFSVPLPQRTVRGVLREPDGRGAGRVDVGARLARPGRFDEGVLHLTRSDEGGAFALEVPDLAFLETRVTRGHGELELWHMATRAGLDWSLSELAPVEVELELGSTQAEGRHWLEWSGPGPEEGGRVSSPLRFGHGPVTLSLPVGALALSLRGADGKRREQSVEVRRGTQVQRIVFAP